MIFKKVLHVGEKMHKSASRQINESNGQSYKYNSDSCT